MSDPKLTGTYFSLMARTNDAIDAEITRVKAMEAALRTIQEAAAGYIHPERRVSAEQLIDIVLSAADDRELVKAMAASES